MDHRKIVVGITGGVAAFKTAALVSRLVQNGFDVQAVMTDSATRFVGPATLMALTGKPVVTSMFDESYPLGPHIEIARERSLLCVAPATANWMAKAANGLADDILSTLYLSFTGSVLIAPAMNCEMWDKAAVQRNVRQLVTDGVHVIEPQEGWLSCRVRGVGRMAEPDEIFERIVQLQQP